MKARRTLNLKIPAGVETGSRLRLAGKGEGGARGGHAGDLYVVIHVRAHPYFQRRGEDIFVDMPLPFDVAALGGEIDVPTIHGHAKLKIPAGTASGTVLRLKGKGVTGLQGYGAGDQHVRLHIEVPDRLDRAQREQMRSLAASVGEEGYPGLREIRRMAAEFYQHKADMENKK